MHGNHARSYVRESHLRPQRSDQGEVRLKVDHVVGVLASHSAGVIKVVKRQRMKVTPSFKAAIWPYGACAKQKVWASIRREINSIWRAYSWRTDTITHACGGPLRSLASRPEILVHDGTLVSNSSRSKANRGPYIQAWYFSLNARTSFHSSVIRVGKLKNTSQEARQQKRLQNRSTITSSAVRNTRSRC